MTAARAIGVNRPGGTEVLEVFSRDVREPGAGEVRLAVAAAAVNPTDILLRTNGIDGEAPWVPGMDAAGTVESVGDGVDRLRVGDRVMAAVRPVAPDGGAQAELVVVPAASVVPVPEGATFEQAATLPMNGLTARLAVDMLGLHSGQTLALSGGAGLVASYAIPLGKLRELRVIADAKPEDEALVRSFGADVVLPRGESYPEAVREHLPGGVDGFIDAALLRQRVLPAIRDGGGLALLRGWHADEPERGIQAHDVRVRSVIERTEWLDEIRELASEGKLQLRVAATFPPDDIAEAHRMTAAGGIRGRAVIVF
jgi:NADPH:quinone reductase-like Zn-dependent oxidoreductase